MSALLHATALVAALVGTAALALRPRWAHAGAIGGSVAMSAAMLDGVVRGAVTAIWWTAAQLALALVLAVIVRCGAAAAPGRVGAGSRGAACPLSVHVALGLIVMAAVTSVMAVPAGGASDPGAHLHMSAGALSAAAGALVLGYAAMTVRHLKAMAHPLHRVHAVAMVVSAAAMSAAVVAA